MDIPPVRSPLERADTPYYIGKGLGYRRGLLLAHEDFRSKAVEAPCLQLLGPALPLSGCGLPLLLDAYGAPSPGSGDEVK